MNNIDSGRLLKRMIDHWNDLLVEPQKYKVLKESFNRRYQTPYNEIAKSSLWVPSDATFYSEVNQQISECVGYQYPAGDIYLPGYDEQKLHHLDLSSDFQASLQDAIIVYCISDEAQPECKINLAKLIIEQVEGSWSIVNHGTTRLKDLLALRFLGIDIFLENTSLLERYLATLHCCIEQMTRYLPNESLRSIAAYKSALKLIHDSICLDLILFDRQFDAVVFGAQRSRSIFCLGLLANQAIKPRQRQTVSESFIQLFDCMGTLSVQLYHLFVGFNDPLRNAVRLLDPYCYLFTSFIATDKRKLHYGRVKKQLQKPASDLSQDSDASLMLVTYAVVKKEVKRNIADYLSGRQDVMVTDTALYDSKVIVESAVNLAASVDRALLTFNLKDSQKVELYSGSSSPRYDESAKTSVMYDWSANQQHEPHLAGQ